MVWDLRASRVVRRNGRRLICMAMAIMWLSGCGSSSRSNEPPEPSHMTLAILAFNDLHGNLEPPGLAIPVRHNDTTVNVPSGGLAYLASAISEFKLAYPHHAVVSAGDMVSASPLISSLFLDEPTIDAVNLIGIDFNAVGNHEFDRGRDELLRLQHGGCEQFTLREPCVVNRAFGGADFGFLAANTFTSPTETLLPATGLKRFTTKGTTITLGVIGMTLRATPTMVTPSGVVGLRFADEVSTANALVPVLRAQGGT